MAEHDTGTIGASTPHFMIIGAAKAGTTTLYDDLSRHPGVFMPSAKEPDILHKADGDEAARRLYALHFAGAAPGQLRAEGSTGYTMVPTRPCVAARARALCGPGLKIIYLMRDPVARIRSQLAHDYAVGRLARAEYDAAIRDDPRYRELSDYAMQARPWIEAFGLEQILFLSFEEFVADRDATLARVFEHLGLDPAGVRAGKGVSNPRGSQRQTRFAWIDRVVRSAQYQGHIRPLLPRAMVDLGKSALTRRRPAPEVVLTPQTEAALARAFAGQAQELAALGITTLPGRGARR
ncbi:MAG: sulfotransferase [Rhodobacteraceae bacterium]|nr:sulfotransferase [Paracoccaceae bacterium]